MMLSIKTIKASHIMGAELTYECLQNNNYRVTLKTYRDCSSAFPIPPSLTLRLFSTSCNQDRFVVFNQIQPTVEVTPLCPGQISSCSGNFSIPGVQMNVFQATINLSMSCPDWIVSLEGDTEYCCRNGAINNLQAPAAQEMFIRALINNTNGLCNSSPTFVNIPVPFVCVGQPVNYNHGTVDAEGDSLRYILVNPMTVGGAPIPYVAGYTINLPVLAVPFSFNNNTGQMSFNAIGQQQSVVAVVIEEYRNGVLVGSVMRDIQIVVLNCNNNIPTITLNNNSISGGQLQNNIITICAGETLSFNVNSTDANAGQIVSLSDNHTQSIPSSSVTYSNNPGNPTTANVIWTPTFSDIGLNVLTFNASDDACPRIGQNTLSVPIRVQSCCTINFTTSIVNPTCNQNNGRITFNVSSAGSTTFSWSANANTSNSSQAINLPSGTYSVTITQNGCTRDTTIQLTGSSPPQFTSTITNPTCGQQNGSIRINVSTTGTPNFTWSANTNTSNSSQAINLSGGNYSVTITQNGCNKDTTFNLVSSSLPVFNTSAINATCSQANGSISLNVTSSGIASYTWSSNTNTGNSNSAFNLPAGTYAVTVSQNGCSRDTTINITTSTNPIFAISLLNPTCGNNNGNISLNVTSQGPTTFAWSANANTSNSNQAINLPAGTYSVTVSQNGCSKDTLISLNSSSSLVANLSNEVNPTCLGADGEVTFNVNGGTAPYTVIIDTGGVSSTINLPGPTSQLINNLSSGTVSIIVTDAQGCQSNANVTLSLPSTCCTFFINTTVSAPNCGLNDGSINILVSNGSGNYSYSWSANANIGNSSNAVNLAVGTYLLTVTDNAYPNCLIDTLFTLSNPNAPIINLVSVTDETCTGSLDGSITINASGGNGLYVYSWSSNANTGNSATASNLGADNYSFTITDANNCEVIGNATLQSGFCCNLQTAITSTGTTCGLSNGSLLVTIINGGQPGYYYSINGGIPQSNNVFSGLMDGNYTIVTIDTNSCSDTLLAVVASSSNTLQINVSTTDVTCYGFTDGTATATFSGGNGSLNLLWNNSQTTSTIQSLSPGNYSITITDIDGCTASVSGIVSEPAQLNVNLGNDLTICEETSAVLDAGAGFQTYNWSSGEQTQTISPTTTSSYGVTVSNLSGCSASDFINVTFINPVEIDLGSDITIYLGESVELNSNISGDGTFNWQPNIGLSCNSCSSTFANPSDTILYRLFYTDDFGCTSVDSIYVFVLPVQNVYIPNAFTPNNDGNNDYFKIFGSSIKSANIQVFDRWGEKIFQTDDYNEGWDGTFKGKDMPPGVYVYSINVVLVNNTFNQFKGSFTLIK